ncbi:UBX domain-containing protein [Histoplasma capsulatum]|uniref:UBX domain-containing protein n=1 Tax=Ajellomyces capsulatus TaxID=5037 RepID=A0A8A1MKS7_AJECA|nr:conserved hypothetical protein [Histoplasma mississippiense (nom. inval.)]EDN05727.1 conserved hypothetical protein [Histoplasma mississippiense (nom. inval.)]QSS65254.1 UBX domain-containing protein [Histoplasma capsulatum]
MPTEEVDLSQLSSSQQNALQTFIAITGGEESAAIQLLQRSEWNTQIAVTKFFDGDGPDLVAEAQAALNNPPARPPRTLQNLMNGDDDIPLRTLSPGRTTELAQRITTSTYRPPFLLAVLFTPFNLLYRLLSSSFGLLGTIFPFLPRLLNTIPSWGAQGYRRDTSGRRPLGPKDTALRFIREFEEEYGSHSIPFLDNGYNMAMEKAHQELKYLLVILLSPEHDLTSSWVRETLLSTEVVDFINDPDNNIMVWAGNVRDSETYQVASSLGCTKFPFFGLIVHNPSVSSSAMSIITKAPGPTTPAEVIEKLRSAITQSQPLLDRVRATRAEQQASRTIRQEQDSAYQRSLAQDRERARKRQEAEAARQRAEKEAQEKKAAAEKLANDLEQWKRWRAQSIPNEPPAIDKNAVRLSIRLASGDRVVRRFSASTGIEELYAFVECYDVLRTDGGEANASGSGNVQPPEGFEHKYGFRLVSPMPRVPYEIEAGGSVGETIGRGGNLVVETIEDEDEDEDNDVEADSGEVRGS